MFKTILLSLALTSTAFAVETTAANTKHDGTPQTGQAKMAVTNMPDAEIAQALLTLNAGEMAHAETAKAKSQNAEVRSFAEMMITEHKANAEETQKLTSDNSIAVKESQVSRELKKDADKQKMSLAKANAKSFDKFYIGQQVEMHEKALNLIDNKLLPSAKNPSLRAHLEKTRAAVAGHLNHARELSKKL